MRVLVQAMPWEFKITTAKLGIVGANHPVGLGKKSRPSRPFRRFFSGLKEWPQIHSAFRDRHRHLLAEMHQVTNHFSERRNRDPTAFGPAHEIAPFLIQFLEGGIGWLIYCQKTLAK
jgi:hypothetical protein